MSTHHQCRYWALQLTLNGRSGSLDQLSRSLSNARVDLNPHQVDAALFAVRSPLSKGVLLADEVGLGKTIEAGLVLAQRWAERRRRVLIIVPATLRKQWAQELDDKFHLPSLVLESRGFNRLAKAGAANPFVQADRVIICSYHFAAANSALVQSHPWDLVVIDEAHRLRNVYKTGNKMARTLRDALGSCTKVLLTATPLQNSLMELYGLVSFIDPHVFGDEPSFRDQFVNVDDEDLRNRDLRQRIAPWCHRTLRRQVLEYISFTKRTAITWEFFPSEDEQTLYDSVSVYLQRDALFALPKGQRKLMTMVLRKLLASSSFAIAATLRGLVAGLEQQAAMRKPAENQGDDAELVADYEIYEETRDEWGDDADGDEAAPEPDQLLTEMSVLKEYVALAERIQHNAKGDALLEALRPALKSVVDLGGLARAVVFTESQRTQAYLFDLLERSGYEGKVVILNGGNSDARSRDIYKAWLARHKGQEVVSGSKPVDIKAAIVEEFRDRAMILVATEAAAEGVNLQFCSLVVNYDLPWNPQRIEQRIGRCHRYGQKHDVVVVNFLNRKNAADQRVHELLDTKFHLFNGVFGSSDPVLGAIESGVDIERRIAEIYQSCRTPADIEQAFGKLQADLEVQIEERHAKTRQMVFEYLDEDVHKRLRFHREALAILDDRGKRLLALAKAELGRDAVFEEGVPRFHYRQGGTDDGRYHFDWKEAERLGDNFFRTEHPLAQVAIRRALDRDLPASEVVFDYGAYGAQVSILAERVGQAGWLRLAKLAVSSMEAEEALLVVAVPDDGNDLLGQEWCDKLLNLPAQVSSALEVPKDLDAVLEQLLQQQHARKLEEIGARNGKYFGEEVDKLDHWAEDVKLSLERELKVLDAEIRTAKKDSKAAVVLADKLEVQRRIKSLEQRRTGKRRQLFDAQDDVDQKRSDLIDGIERQLETKAQRETVFTIRWILADTTRK